MTPSPFLALLLVLLLPGHLLAVPGVPIAPPPTAADSPARQAIETLREGRPTAAVEMAKPLAEKGDRDALFLMGYALESMLDAPRQSRGQAMEYYYGKAAAAGHPDAEMRHRLIRLATSSKPEREEMRRALEAEADAKTPLTCRILGEAWLRGFADGKADADKALHYWSQAAAAGDRYALILIARLRTGDFGFPEKRDPAEAINAYRQALDLGEAEALLPLGTLLLAAGSEEEGHALLEKALAQGDLHARLALGDYEALTRKDRKAALQHYLAGAEAGQTDCMHRLATFLLEEDGAAPQARQWLQRAADAGDPDAAADLGHRLLQDSPPDFTNARRYLSAAAIEQQRRAQYDLALLYLEGKGCAPDPVAAVAWLTEAMKSGDPAVQYKLATLHEAGRGTPLNYANAGVLYTLACNKGHAASATRIARMAAEGLGTTKSAIQAWAYASLAVELGDENANALVAELDASLNPADREAAQKALAGLRAVNQKTLSQGG